MRKKDDTIKKNGVMIYKKYDTLKKNDDTINIMKSQIAEFRRQSGNAKGSIQTAGSKRKSRDSNSPKSSGEKGRSKQSNLPGSPPLTRACKRASD